LYLYFGTDIYFTMQLHILFGLFLNLSATNAAHDIQILQYFVLFLKLFATIAIFIVLHTHKHYP